MTNRYRTSVDDPVKVVFYGRVSTQHEQQMNAMDNQILWYDSLLKDHPNWKKVNTYWDKGISGTVAEKRPGFMKMINDAKKGLFDLIVTRETSRFARNTVDSLKYTRELADMGVEVFFYNDNIWSKETDGELRLTIMSAMSQEESRHISERVLSGQKTSREEQILYGNGNILGYNLVRGLKSKDNTYVINEEQADTVRRIFQLYLQGYGAKRIADILMQEGRRTATGLYRWTVTNVIKTIKNKTYAGYICYNKSKTKSYLNHNRVNITDMDEHEYIKADFPAIIDEQTFNKAQEIRCSKISNAGKHGRNAPVDKWLKKLRCECGYTFKKYKWRENKNGDKFYGYTCYNQVNNRSKSYYIKNGLPTEGRCRVASWCDWKLEFAFKAIMERFWKNPVDTVNVLMDKISDNYEVVKTECDIATEKLEREKERLQARLDTLLDMRLDGSVDKKSFDVKHEQLSSRLEEITLELESASMKPTTEQVARNISDEITVIREYLEDACDFNAKNISEDLIDVMIERITPTEEGVTRWYLRTKPDKLRIKFDENSFVKYDEIVLKFDEAREYRKSQGNFLRKSQWKDIKIEVYIEIE